MEIKRVALDAEPVAGIIKHLESTGRLLLQRSPSAEQAILHAAPSVSVGQISQAGLWAAAVTAWPLSVHAQLRRWYAPSADLLDRPSIDPALRYGGGRAR